jgi:hypothetical protein
VENDSTLELRADLVRLSENATNLAAIYLAGTWENGQFYSFIKGHDFVMLGKYGLAPVGESVFACDRAVIKNTNVVLSLALTRVNPNVVLTARVLDKDNHNAVLYERSVVDTPAVDRCLTTDEVFAASGMNLAFLTDRSGAPYTWGSAIVLATLQCTDGNQPAVAAVFDNVELRTLEVPGIGIERAVRLSWPASASINYSVEGAPTLQGPFVPVQDLVTPGMNQMTVPASDLMRFFRLVNAP